MSFDKPRLGVNIDHVATLRQARGEKYPSTVEAARVSLENGADQITIHLREDRRHIQDFDAFDIQKVTKEFQKPLNFEMGSAQEIVDIALKLKPEWICLVPEKREERTTEGGLDLKTKSNFEKIKSVCETFRNSIPQTKISLFVEAEQETLERCIDLKVDAVEIHTGDYAKAFLDGGEYKRFIAQFEQYKNMMIDSGISYHAGHGLTKSSVAPLVELQLFEEYNIGHWIISQSIYDGLATTVKNLKHTIEG
jgi:pyridoxine 5-phosphate synthase